MAEFIKWDGAASPDSFYPAREAGRAGGEANTENAKANLKLNVCVRDLKSAFVV